MATNPMFVGSLRTPIPNVRIIDTGATTVVDLIAGASSGTKVYSISACTDDTVAVTLTLYMNDGTNDRLLGTSYITASSNKSVLNLDDFPFLNEDLSIYLPANCKLRIKAGANLSSAKVCDVVAYAGDY